MIQLLSAILSSSTILSKDKDALVTWTFELYTLGSKVTFAEFQNLNFRPVTNLRKQWPTTLAIMTSSPRPTFALR